MSDNVHFPGDVKKEEKKDQVPPAKRFGKPRRVGEGISDEEFDRIRKNPIPEDYDENE